MSHISMAGLRKRGKKIRQFILDNIELNPNNIGSVTADRFDISRQAVNVHIRRLVKQGSLIATGNTRNRVYKLNPLVSKITSLKLNGLEEDQVWRQTIVQRLGGLPDNIIDIWHYGFTEMMNNAIDHSEGSQITVAIEKNALNSEIIITDNGEGIFRRIQRILGLIDERHAVFELSKGKLTTDPDNHTGEGIFFTSRAFDEYAILSGGVYFSHEFNKPEDWIMEREAPEKGTSVFMRMSNHSSRTLKSIFDQYTSGDDYGFNKTVVPVSLVRYGNEMLVSRSQAKRLIARIERFKVVILDFNGVEKIGQAFADEIFRVFKSRNPTVELHFIKVNTEVEQMIVRALLNG